LSKDNEFYFFNVKTISYKNYKFEFLDESDVYIKLMEDDITLHILSDMPVNFSSIGLKDCGDFLLKPGDSIICKF